MKIAARAVPRGLLTRRTVLGGLLLTSSGWSARAASDDAPRLTLPPLAEGHKRLYLCRHGETDWNVQRRIQGLTNNPLNANGRAQAEALGGFLRDAPLDTIVDSMLRRSAETADLIAASHPGAERLHDSRFGEMGFGEYEGKVLDEFMEEYHAMLDRWAAGETSAAWPGSSPAGVGESVDDVAIRGRAALGALGLLGERAGGSPRSKAWAAGTERRHVCVVAHGRFNKCLIAELTSERRRSSEVAQGNCCVNVIDCDPETGECFARALDVQDHLVGLAGTADPAPVIRR